MALKDYLPDFKGALTGFYEESLKNTVETKTNEFKTLLEQNIAYGQKTQRALTVPLMVIAISLKVLVLSVMVQELSSSVSKNLAHRQQKLSGLFLDRDVDYRTLLAEMEAQFSEEKQSDQEYLAEEIAL
ncbi:8177_t:CDS:2 [Funneliformis geosporum]|uniref:8177_t:CDS:1 n=1 Tax=Funneliformis geosporum TaxID=1117311 RepID=A0A9W4T6X2_9GLOM|nr:8177_t:CDS:2 [Funneliformis geosporum]